VGPDIERKLAAFVRSHIRASRRGDSPQAEEALRWVCAAFERVLELLLHECDEWTGWIDGVVPATDMLPDAIEVSSDVILTLRGQALWGERPSGPMWIEPFYASVRIDDVEDVLIGYRVDFGDAARGLGTFPHDKHVRYANWYSPAEWLFRFSKGASGEVC
jgi:hypothetical protein